MYKTGTPNDIEFHKKIKPGPGIWPFLVKICKKYNKNARILDVGCSMGDKLLHLYNLGYHNITGIDYCPDLYEATLKSYPYLNIKKGNAEHLQLFQSQQFDIVYCNHVLEHLPHPESAIKEAKRVLKKGGKYIVGIPNGYHLNDIIMRLIQKLRYGRSDHLQVFSLQKITKLLENNEFEVKKVESDLGSIDLLTDMRLNKMFFNIPKLIFYPIIKKIYYRKIGYNIEAIKK